MDSAQLEPVREHSYSDAICHYTSAQRRDPVKTEWEEPFSIEIYRRALAHLGSPEAVAVLDVGCGTGDGLSLIFRTLQQSPATANSCLRYVGMDNSLDMILQARELHRQEQSATFIERDIREGVPEAPVDLYLSCGVPYSHLTEDDLESSLTQIFLAIRRNHSRSAVIIDVLGRYSIEWPSRWAHTRWPYRMSFFATDATMRPVDMSFYSATSLSSLLERCATRARIVLESKQFFDRSIAAGRHTSTGEYNDNLPPVRNYVNSLYSEANFELSLLYLPPIGERGYPRVLSAAALDDFYDVALDPSPVTRFAYAIVETDYGTDMLARIAARALDLRTRAQNKFLGLVHLRAAQTLIPEVFRLMHDTIRLSELSAVCDTELEPYPLTGAGAHINYYEPHRGTIDFHTDGPAFVELIPLVLDGNCGGGQFRKAASRGLPDGGSTLWSLADRHGSVRGFRQRGRSSACRGCQNHNRGPRGYL